MSINYKNKNVGMTYVKNGVTYTINHGIFKVIDFDERGEFIFIHIQNHEYDCIITPYIDTYINLTPGCFIKVAYIVDNGAPVCHGYELSDEIITGLPEPKKLVIHDQEVNIEETYSKIDDYINLIKDNDIRTLVNFIITKEYDKFTTYPAAVSVHHNIKSGLMLHTLNVVRNAITIANNYKDIDYDILIAGALLHDIGKVYEYTVTGTISNEGLFADHISIGSRIFIQAAEVLDVNLLKRDIYHINHIILSHHGKLEWGSTKIPATKEAFIVHQADYIDSQMYIYHEELKALDVGESSRNKYIGSNIIQTKLESSTSYCQ